MLNFDNGVSIFNIKAASYISGITGITGISLILSSLGGNVK